MACSTAVTKILPSPIFPVNAALMIASIAASTMAAGNTTSTRILGRKSTTYSAPRYSSVWPFCRPKPLTSVTVSPLTPISASASRTSSSLNGLMIAATNFIRWLRLKEKLSHVGEVAACRGLIQAQGHLGQYSDKMVENIALDALVFNPSCVIGKAIDLYGYTLRFGFHHAHQHHHVLAHFRLLLQVGQPVSPERTEVGQSAPVHVQVGQWPQGPVALFEFALLAIEVITQQGK